MRISLCTLALLLCLPLAAQKVPTAKVEKLSYTGYYNWGFVWIKAGFVDFTLSPSGKYPHAQRLLAVGASNPSWDWIFRLRDTLISYHDSLTFMPYEFSRKAHEGNYHKTFDYTWDYNKGHIYADVERIGKYKRQDTILLRPETYDMLSVAWLARQLDFDNYEKGALIPIRLLVDDKIHDLHIRYLGTERVKIEKERRLCHVFSPLLLSGNVFKGGETMKIWVSDDAYRIPLMVEAKILIGSVKGIIDETNSKYK